jgi:protoheme IX farnesyltransferase
MNPYIVLLKPRVIWLLILASAAGYVYAAPQIEWNKLASLLLAAALSIGGAAAFNHYWERDIDALMARTAKRPLPAGLVSPGNALMYSLALSAAGIAAGFYLLGPLPGLFVALGWFSYVVVYTMWLKRRTWLNILGGGFAGNATFLGGYALAKGTVDLPALLISFAIYLWIPSHIWALAHRYRQDYRKASVPMLPVLVKEEKGCGHNLPPQHRQRRLHPPSLLPFWKWSRRPRFGVNRRSRHAGHKHPRPEEEVRRSHVEDV